MAAFCLAGKFLSPEINCVTAASKGGFESFKRTAWGKYLSFCEPLRASSLGSVIHCADKIAVVRLIRVDRSFNSVLYLLRKKLVCVYNFVLWLSFYNCACFKLFFKVMDFCLKLSYFFLSFVSLTSCSACVVNIVLYLGADIFVF